jgi:hypothetical protein
MEPSQKNKGRFLLCVKIIPRKTTKLQQTEPSLSARPSLLKISFSITLVMIQVCYI